MADNIVYTDDYIVEEGTSGIWTYRKWASGIAECWGATEWVGTIPHKFGSVYVNGISTNIDALPQETYPFEFAEIPNCIYSLESNYFLWPSGNNAYATTTTTPRIYIYRPESDLVDTKANATINWMVKGRWKQGG